MQCQRPRRTCIHGPTLAPPSYVLQTLTHPSCSRPRTHDMVYRRLGMRTSPFQMQIPTRIGMYTSSLLQLLHSLFPTPVAAAPYFELVLPTSPPYSNKTPWFSTRPRSSSTFSKTANSPYPACPLYTALQARSGKAGENWIGRSHQSRWWISESLEGPHQHARPDSAPAVTAMEIERLSSHKGPSHLRGQRQHDNRRGRSRGWFLRQPTVGA